MKKFKRIVLAFLAAVVIVGAVNFAPMISRKTPGMQLYTYGDLSVYAEPEDAGEVEGLAEKIIESRERITAALKGGSSNDIEIIIYPDRKVLHRKTIGLAGMLLPDWYIGKNTKNHVLITSPANPGPAHQRASIEKAAVHEYVHLMTDRQNKAMGYWLKEGFALYLAGQKPSKDTIRANRNIAYRDFTQTNALRFAEVGGYSLAYDLLSYMEEEYGWDRVIGFLTPGSTYEDALGVSEQELFNNWKSRLMTL